MSGFTYSKYHRKEPILKFDKNQILYDAVVNTNVDNMDGVFSSYFGKNKTFKDLKNETDRLVTAINHDGFNNDGVVGVMMLTVPSVGPILLAPNYLGMKTFWMDVTSKPDDLIKYINGKNIKLLFIVESLVPLIKNIINYTCLEKVVFVPEVNENKLNNYDDIRFVNYNSYVDCMVDKDIKKVKYEKDRPSIYVQSSGSTGKPKSILHSDYNFNSEIEKITYTDIPFYRKNSTFVCAPPWVIYGLVDSMYSGMVLGNKTVYSLQPDEKMLFENLGTYDIAYAVPVYIRYLVNELKKLEKSNIESDKILLNDLYNKLEKVKAFISGGDKLSESDTIEFQHILRTPILNGYGNNECVGAAIVQPLYANKPGSIGIPMYGNIVKSFDENNNELSSNVVGNIKISSDALFLGYDGNKEEESKIKTKINGIDYVDTGDLGYIDNDGYVYITGRSKRIIIDKLGYKISPDNIENCVSKNKYVKDCCAVGLEIEENNCIVVLFVELNEEYKYNEEVINSIKDYCRNSLKDYEIPSIIYEIDKIPHKSNGGKTNFLFLEEKAKEMYFNSQNDYSLKKHK